MAVTIVLDHLMNISGRTGRERVKLGVFKVTFDSGYVTNGEVWNLSQYFHRVFHISTTPAEDGTSGGFLPVVTDTKFNSTTSILVEMFLQDATSAVNKALAECTSGRQLQSVVIRAIVLGD